MVRLALYSHDYKWYFPAQIFFATIFIGSGSVFPMDFKTWKYALYIEGINFLPYLWLFFQFIT